MKFILFRQGSLIKLRKKFKKPTVWSKEKIHFHFFPPTPKITTNVGALILPGICLYFAKDVAAIEPLARECQLMPQRQLRTGNPE